jgi:S-adenosylmethionine:tRNA ribosyltransferase-isomerase
MTSNPKNIKTADYTYSLPDERIAKYPLSERDSSKLLVYKNNSLSDKIFRDLPSLLPKETLLVFNNTKVIRARLFFEKETGARIEVFCLEPLTPFDFAMNLAAGPGVEWKCLVGNLKKWKGKEIRCRFVYEDKAQYLNALQVGNEGDAQRIRFTWENESLSFSEILQAIGHIPIPPYLNREDEVSDIVSYQTIYSKTEGSVAAPTAGLHFTDAVLNGLVKEGIESAEVTLHVSAGTFKPVKSERISDHEMHKEHFIVTRDTILKLFGKDIIAVGTTSVRTLESLYWLGSDILSGKIKDDDKLCVTQWQPYENTTDYTVNESLGAILEMMKRKKQESISVETGIIIIPGYRFRLVKGLVTNFHQPGSTLLLLVAALIGEKWKEIYSHALEADYRFLSYGDSMLLLL